MDNFVPHVPSILIVELGLDLPQILDFDFCCNTIPSEKISINSNFEEFFDEHHIDLLIHGHTHRPNTHQTNTGTRIVLGDWHKTGWCLMLDEQQQELREFTL